LIKTLFDKKYCYCKLKKNYIQINGLMTKSLHDVITSHLNSLHIVKTKTYDVENTGPDLGQAHKM